MHLSRDHRATTRKPQLVVEAVMGRIRSGEWEAGAKLPSERDLASECHVGRAAVREALRTLQLSGHVETRLGEGSFVCAARVSGGPEDDAGLLAGMSISESLETREAVELSCAVLAVRRATRSDVLKLQAVVVELEEHLERHDYKAYLLCTLDLHMLVAAAAHNSFLSKVVTELTVRHREDQWLLHRRYAPDVAAFSLDVHRDLADAIVNRDQAGAVDATVRHYEDYPVLHRHQHGDGDRR